MEISNPSSATNQEVAIMGKTFGVMPRAFKTPYMSRPLVERPPNAGCRDMPAGTPIHDMSIRVALDDELTS